MHILLIEPDTVLANIYRSAFMADEHNVVVAVSAQAAVHEADQKVPDVVVLELQLQQHNGIEFLYEFRSYSEWLNVPIVIHTFVPPSELASAATLQHELGITRVLYKPTTSLAVLRHAVIAAHSANV